jgi:hypothetical protein
MATQQMTTWTPPWPGLASSSPSPSLTQRPVSFSCAQGLAYSGGKEQSGSQGLRTRGQASPFTDLAFSRTFEHSLV